MIEKKLVQFTNDSKTELQWDHGSEALYVRKLEKRKKNLRSFFCRTNLGRP